MKFLLVILFCLGLSFFMRWGMMCGSSATSAMMIGAACIGAAIVATLMAVGRKF